MSKLTKTFTLLAVACCMLAGCYSNNCPMENVVLCNYYFYDMTGTPIKYNDTITVATLQPGWREMYTYKRLGYKTVTKEYLDSTMVEAGYTVTKSMQRNETILENLVTGASSLSLPVSYFFDADTLIFSYSNITLKDTMIVEKESYPHVELPECGTYRFHTLKSIRCTDAAIDSIAISHPQVNYDGSENVRIFFNGVAL